MERALANAPDRYEIPIQSRSISRLYMQSGFGIQIFDDGAQTTIRIQEPIAVVSENPKPLARLQAEDAFSPAFGVFGKIVISGDSLRRGHRVVEVVFNPGVWFWVEPKRNPDEWGPFGSKGLLLICMPGSEMAVWFGIRKSARMSETLDDPIAAVV